MEVSVGSHGRTWQACFLKRQAPIADANDIAGRSLPTSPCRFENAVGLIHSVCNEVLCRRKGARTLRRCSWMCIEFRILHRWAAQWQHLRIISQVDSREQARQSRVSTAGCPRWGTCLILTALPATSPAKGHRIWHKSRSHRSWPSTIHADKLPSRAKFRTIAAPVPSPYVLRGLRGLHKRHWLSQLSIPNSKSLAVGSIGIVLGY
jgi:hypothetical protein